MKGREQDETEGKFLPTPLINRNILQYERHDNDYDDDDDDDDRVLATTTTRQNSVHDWRRTRCE